MYCLDKMFQFHVKLPVVSHFSQYVFPIKIMLHLLAIMAGIMIESFFSLFFASVLCSLWQSFLLCMFTPRCVILVVIGISSIYSGWLFLLNIIIYFLFLLILNPQSFVMFDNI